MATPMYPMAGPPPMMEHPELSSLKSLLSAARIVALVLWILGILWVLGALVAAAFAAAFGVPTAILGVIYPVLFTIVNLLTWMRLPQIEAQVNRGEYAAARDATLLWMVLGWFFLFINGLILLLAWLKFDTVIRSGGVAMGVPPGYVPPVGATPGMPYAAPGAAAPMPPPAAPAMAPPAAAGSTPCPRCGRPLTWIPQYSRWYCYSEQQYA